MTTPERDALVMENERLRTALGFYADPRNWKSPSTGFAAQYDPEPSPIKAAGEWKPAAEVLRGARK